MVGQDLDEGLFVLGLEQVLKGAFGKLGEGFVGRGEDGERAFAGEDVDEVGGLDGGDQRAERLIASGGFDNRLVLSDGRGAEDEREGEGGKRTHEQSSGLC